MNVLNTVSVIALILCAGFVGKVSNEIIQCWECSTNSQEQCGNYDRVGDQELANMTKECKPIGFLTRACYRTVIRHDEGGVIVNELRLFCGPAIAHKTVCMMIGFFMIKLGAGNLTLTHCSVCSLPLCNAGVTLNTRAAMMFLTVWLTIRSSFKNHVV
ncbi:hypothetical protein GE061_010515 [Apolygus lucorum]|uniref:Protein sleepless n=1 Tax=Apolygus lucorum TaxID=248454 RepID=A0A6A4K676_APOLU|nr:hypothetical protein GE061_010515 [Apolygus lucorum]